MDIQVLRNDILADPVLSKTLTDPQNAVYPPNADGAWDMAIFYNQVVTPDYWIYKSWLTHADIVGRPSVEGTQWSWTAYIARSAGERDAWAQLFRDGGVNPSLTNVQNAIADIFSGGPGAAQRAHCLAAARRKASRYEKIYATGSGTAGSPSVTLVLNPVYYTTILEALQL